MINFYFFLNHKESLIHFNTNILETNLINILLLISLIIYTNKISFSKTLENRQKEIAFLIENAQQDIILATKYYKLSEVIFLQSTFYLNFWKKKYFFEKITNIEKKYEIIKNLIKDNFSNAENLLKIYEKKITINLQNYILFLTIVKILKNFLRLSSGKKSQIIQNIIYELGKNYNEY